MKQVSLDGKYAPRDSGVLTKQVADEMVIVDMQKGIYHGLNPVGALIWDELDGEQSLSDIATGLMEQYPDVERATIEADMLALMQALLDNDLVVTR